MGLLSHLFPDRTNDILPDAPLKKVSEELPELFEGMALIVTKQSGKQLLTGRLTDFTTSSLTIERQPGQLSFHTCEAGTAVEIKGYTRDMTAFCLKGLVQESSRIVCKLKDVEAVPVPRQRNNFRLTLNIPASLHYPSDEHFKNPEACMLIDLSSGGACIESEFLHAEEEVLQLRFKIEEYQSMNFLGEIIRVMEPAPGHFQYGFLFAQLTEDETASLTRTLFNLQTGNRREWSRSEVGHW